MHRILATVTIRNSPCYAWPVRLYCLYVDYFTNADACKINISLVLCCGIHSTLTEPLVLNKLGLSELCQSSTSGENSGRSASSSSREGGSAFKPANTSHELVEQDSVLPDHELTPPGHSNVQESIPVTTPVSESAKVVEGSVCHPVHTTLSEALTQLQRKRVCSHGDDDGSRIVLDSQLEGSVGAPAGKRPKR